MTFTMQKIQSGYWGRTVTKETTIKAASLEEAKAKAIAKGYKRLLNGDMVSFAIKAD